MLDTNNKKLIAESYREIATKEFPMDEEEKEIFSEWKNIKENDLITIPEQTKLKLLNKIKTAQDNYKAQTSKNKIITMRTNEQVINKIKIIANNLGLNYQSYIGMLLKLAADGNININLVQK